MLISPLYALIFFKQCLSRTWQGILNCHWNKNHDLPFILEQIFSQEKNAQTDTFFILSTRPYEYLIQRGTHSDKIEHNQNRFSFLVKKTVMAPAALPLLSLVVGLIFYELFIFFTLFFLLQKQHILFVAITHSVYQQHEQLQQKSQQTKCQVAILKYGIVIYSL